MQSALFTVLDQNSTTLTRPLKKKNPEAQLKIVLVMQTRRSPRHAPLSRILCNFHSLQCSHGTTALFSNHGGGGSALLRCWHSRAKLCCFLANHDSRARTTRRSDGPRRYKRASITFNTLAEGTLLSLPRSCRVADKSDPIGSREPNCDVFSKSRQSNKHDSTLRWTQTL